LETLRRIRTMRGMNQVDLADASGVAQNTISEIELGKREARPGTLKKLAGALGVEISDLLGEETSHPLGEASQPSLEDAAQSDTIDEDLALLFRGLARHGQWIVDQSLEHGSSAALSREAAEFTKQGMALRRIKGRPAIFGRESDELAEAEDDYDEIARRIGRLVEQDVNAPEKAKEAYRFKKGRELRAKKDSEIAESRADAS
jgi:transcriptional regulator with XRE-family HTH domain